jgi:hypothetical protein
LGDSANAGRTMTVPSVFWVNYPRLLRRALEQRGAATKRPHMRVLDGVRHSVERSRRKRIIADGNRLHRWRLEPFLLESYSR